VRSFESGAVGLCTRVRHWTPWTLVSVSNNFLMHADRRSAPLTARFAMQHAPAGNATQRQVPFLATPVCTLSTLSPACCHRYVTDRHPPTRISSVAGASTLPAGQHAPLQHARRQARWRCDEQLRQGLLTCLGSSALDASALEQSAEPATEGVPAADNGGLPPVSTNGAYAQNGSPAQPQQSPAAGPAAFAVALYKFSRPHTMIGTFISICSISALALVSNVSSRGAGFLAPGPTAFAYAECCIGP